MTIKPEYLRYLDHLGASVTLAEFHARPELADAIALRHDIDHDLDLALEMAHYEAERKMRATYFLLHTVPYWQDPCFALKCRQLAAYGHEVALHCNVFTEWVQGRIDDVDRRLGELLAQLRATGLPIVGTSAHGDRCCYQHQFINYWMWRELRGPDPAAAQKGRCAEGPVVDDPQWQIAYPPDHALQRGDGARLPLWQVALADHGLCYDAAHVPFDRYWTDSGGHWTRSGDPLQADLSRGRHQVLVHPWWWRGQHKKIFVLSTARSGSKWLANFVDQATSCKGLHEWTLNHERQGGQFVPDKRTSCDYLDLVNDPHEANRRLAEANSHFVRQHRDVLEANVYLEPFLELISDRVPGAQIIHLHRDGRDVVRSLINRSWYEQPDDRRHPVIPSVPWKRLSQFERACCYYHHVNERLSQVAATRWCFERMVRDQAYLVQRLRDLGIVVHPLLAETVFHQTVNANQRDEFPGWKAWPAQFQQTFADICGDIHVRLGYDPLTAHPGPLATADRKPRWTRESRQCPASAGRLSADDNRMTLWRRVHRKSKRVLREMAQLHFIRLSAAWAGNFWRRLTGRRCPEVLLRYKLVSRRPSARALERFGWQSVGVHGRIERQGLFLSPSDPPQANAHVLLSQGSWARVLPRQGLRVVPHCYYRGYLEATWTAPREVRLFVLSYDAGGALLDKQHVANVRAARPITQFAFCPTKDASHFTVALHFGAGGWATPLELRFIHLERVPLPADYQALSSDPVATTRAG